MASVVRAYPSVKRQDLLRADSEGVGGRNFDGGRHFGAGELGKLVDALDANPRGTRTLLRLELWDMPLLFLLLIGLLSAEWFYRRWRGLV